MLVLAVSYLLLSSFLPSKFGWPRAFVGENIISETKFKVRDFKLETNNKEFLNPNVRP